MMTADEPPGESEPNRNVEQSKTGQQTRPNLGSEPAAKAENGLRKRNICPYLGLREHRAVVSMQPTPAHACYAQRQRYLPSLEHQRVRCLSSNYPGCSLYPGWEPDKDTSDNLYTLQGEIRRDGRGGRRWLGWAGMALLVVLLGALAYAVANGLLPLPTQLTFNPTPVATVSIAASDAAPAVVPAVTETPTVIPTKTPTKTATETSVPTLTLTPPDSTPTAVTQGAEPTARNTPRLVTVTPEGEGEVVTISPSRADVGWWASVQTQPGQIGDAFLYAGVYEAQAYVSAVRFDLRRVPRGTRIERAVVRLTGLRDDRLDRSTNSSWVVQLIAESALPELAGVTFFTLYEAPASFQLAPDVETEDVGAGRVNEWVLDATTHGWLFQQLADGATSVVVRIVALENAGNALFAWDSGHGTASRGAAPELVLDLGPAPPTPTRPQGVATLTPTPENVMTVVPSP